MDSKVEERNKILNNKFEGKIKNIDIKTNKEHGSQNIRLNTGVKETTARVTTFLALKEVKLLETA